MTNTATIIDGRTIAGKMRAKTALQVEQLKQNNAPTPGLAVVLVGDNDASRVYVRNKIIKTSQAGMNSFHYKLDSSVTEKDLLDLIGRLNVDPLVHGILVQLPLPDHINESAVINTVLPKKDVDGFHVINVGRLQVGQDGLMPCTPVGCMELIHSYTKDLAGMKALIVGRSNIVGKPLAALLLREHCTVAIAHSRTRNLADECAQADLLISAVGKAHLIKGDWIKPGAIVVDVGINRIIPKEGSSSLAGDVDFEEAIKVASAITPVPGGVGPMTIACLLKNTLLACCYQHDIPVPA